MVTKVVMYARATSVADCSRQILACAKSLASTHPTVTNFTVLADVGADGRTASTAAAAIDAAAGGEEGVLVVENVSRLSRSEAEIQTILEKCSTAGIKVLCVAGNESLDARGTP